MRTLAQVFGTLKSDPPGNFTSTTAAWNALPIQERAVQWAAYFADVVKIREVGGNNRGFWIKAFLEYTGFNTPQPWCAADMSYCLMKAGFTGFRSAAVLGWRDWAVSNHKLVTKPVRGALAFWVKKGSRHIEIVVATEGQACDKRFGTNGIVPAGMICTIGGNTGPGASGSQNDGDGHYRRVRRVSEFTGFIRWW